MLRHEKKGWTGTLVHKNLLFEFHNSTLVNNVCVKHEPRAAVEFAQAVADMSDAYFFNWGVIVILNRRPLHNCQGEWISGDSILTAIQTFASPPCGSDSVKFFDMQ